MTNEQIIEECKKFHPSFKVEREGDVLKMTVKHGGTTWGRIARLDGSAEENETRANAMHHAALHWSKEHRAVA